MWSGPAGPAMRESLERRCTHEEARTEMTAGSVRMGNENSSGRGIQSVT
jgi:hypothetical protein